MIHYQVRINYEYCHKCSELPIDEFTINKAIQHASNIMRRYLINVYHVSIVEVVR